MRLWTSVQRSYCSFVASAGLEGGGRLIEASHFFFEFPVNSVVPSGMPLLSSWQNPFFGFLLIPNNYHRDTTLFLHGQRGLIAEVVGLVTVCE